MLRKSFALKNELERILSIQIIDALRVSINRKGEATLLVSGGSTPIGLFKELSEFGFDWEKVTIGLVDERYVPTDNGDSNEKLIKTNLLINKALSANFIGMIYDDSDYKINLEIATKKNSVFNDGADVVVLGMGTDAHTASLFPSDLNIKEHISSEKVLLNTTAPSFPEKRITFTPHVLRKSRNLFLHITGEKKLELITSAENEKNEIKHPIFSFINPKLTMYYTA